MIEDNLRELDFGIFEGLTREQVKEKYGDIFKERKKDKFNYQFPKGESYADTENRALKVLEKVIKTKKDSIIVAHGNINKLLFKNLLKKPFDDVNKHYYNNTSLSVFNIKGNDVFVEEFNCDNHLR